MEGELPELMVQLVASRQEVDTLEKEVLARTRENMLLKQQLQDFTDYAEGLSVRMPGQWTLEEQITALRLVLRATREDMIGENVSEINVEEKDMPGLIRLAFAENEEQAREIRRLERKLIEQSHKDQKTSQEKGSKSSNMDYIENLEHVCADGTGLQEGSDEEVAKTSSGLRCEAKAKTELNDDSLENLQLLTSSKAKLKKNKKFSSHKKSADPAPVAKSIPPVSKLSDEEFCDLQIKLLEAGHELSKEEQLAVEEVMAKMSDAGSEKKKMPAVQEVKPCQVIMTDFSWGLSPGAVVRHVRDYEGVSQIKVEGDTAIITFMNLEYAHKFRGEGENHIVGGFSLPVGDIVVVEEFEVSSKAINVKEDLISVAVKVKRRVVGGK